MRKSVCRFSLGLFGIALSATGCRISLPPPTIQELKAPQSLTRELLCPGATSQAQFVIRDNSSVSGALDCTGRDVTVVLFNGFNVRVRTITLAPSHMVRDENTYLSPSSEPADALLARVAHALHSRNQGEAKDSVHITSVQQH